MRAVNEAEIAYRPVSGHRTGDIQFKRLLQGDPGALDNYELSLVRNRGSYYTPRHRHNFDQMRLVVEGEFGYATRKKMRAGDAGYFPEGTYYGPQTVTDSVMLILQCGAPSGAGFLDYDSLHQGHLEMEKLGRFENGIFHRNPGSNQPAGRRKQDSYEAIWEHKRGRRLTYPKARYAEPVIMNTAAFDWHPTAAAGVQTKLLGHFVRDTRMEMLKIDQDADALVAAPGAIQLLYVLSGEGRAFVEGAGLHDATAWRGGSAIEIARGETVRLQATQTAEIFLVGMSAIAGLADIPNARAA